MQATAERKVDSAVMGRSFEDLTQLVSNVVVGFVAFYIAATTSPGRGIVLSAMALAALVVPIVGSNLLATQKTLQRLQYFVPVPVFLVSLIGVDVAQRERVGTEAFYDAAVQVIAVLLLAIVFEGRSIVRTRARSIDDFTGMSITLIFLGFGGYFALQALATEAPTADDYQIVVAAMVAGLSGVAAVALLHPQVSSQEEA